MAVPLLIAVLLVAETMRRRLDRSRRSLARLEGDMASLRDQLESAGRLRTELLSRIGLSLRKPLDTLRTATDELQRPLECPDWMKDQLSSLTLEIDSIGKLIDLIGEIAALDEKSKGKAHGELSSEPPVDLEALLADVVQASADRLAERGVSLAVAMDPIVVNGDQGYLRQAMEALVTETERRAGRGSIVHLDLGADDGTARLTLNYRGPTDPEAATSPLSMELARHILTWHGGWLQEGARRGQFTVVLPLAPGRAGRRSEGDEQDDLPEV